MFKYVTGNVHAEIICQLQNLNYYVAQICTLTFNEGDIVVEKHWTNRFIPRTPMISEV